MQNTLTWIACNTIVHYNNTRVPCFSLSFLEIGKSFQILNLEGVVFFGEPGARLCVDVGDCAQQKLHHVGDCVRDIDHAVLRYVVVRQSFGKGADTKK
jgi:hypothetical protein